MNTTITVGELIILSVASIITFALVKTILDTLYEKYSNRKIRK
jgi:hypothetical protein